MITHDILNLEKTLQLEFSGICIFNRVTESAAVLQTYKVRLQFCVRIQSLSTVQVLYILHSPNWHINLAIVQIIKERNFADSVKSGSSSRNELNKDNIRKRLLRGGEVYLRTRLLFAPLLH